MSNAREFSLIILETVEQQIVLQLRDATPTISHPNHWALFGGRLAPGEHPELGIIREVSEELTIALDRARLQRVGTFRVEADKVHHVYAYLVRHELDRAVLREGQRYAGWSRTQLRQQRLDGYPIIPSHYHYVHAYWQAQQQLDDHTH